MGKNIKRLSLALLALGLSAPAFADTCNPFNVTVPNQQGGFTIGADALYLQPSVPNGAYNFTANTATTVTAPFITNGSINSVDPTYHWGFDVTAAYRICGTGNDISATWTHLSQNSDSDTVHLVGVVNPLTEVNGNADVTGSLQFNYDAVDVDVGQRVNFGDYFQFRTFAGVRWAQVEDDSTVNAIYSSAVAIPVIQSSQHFEQNSKFDGIGPQAGFDGRYCLGYGFGLDANLTASLLVGKTDNDVRYTQLPAAATTVASRVVDLTVNTKDRVVPAIDASLGLDYTYNFNNCDRSSLVIQAGWKVVNYFDAGNRVDDNDVAALAGTTGLVTPGFGHGTDSHNIAFQGPYAGVKVNL